MCVNMVTYICCSRDTFKWLWYYLCRRSTRWTQRDMTCLFKIKGGVCVCVCVCARVRAPYSCSLSTRVVLFTVQMERSLMERNWVRHACLPGHVCWTLTYYCVTLGKNKTRILNNNDELSLALKKNKGELDISLSALLWGCCWNNTVVFPAFIFNECGASTEQDRLPEVGDSHVTGMWQTCDRLVTGMCTALGDM